MGLDIEKFESRVKKGKVLYLDSSINFSNINERLDRLEDENKGLKTEVSGLDSKVFGLKTKISELNSTVSGLNSEVFGLNSKVSGLNSKISGLEKTKLSLCCGELSLFMRKKFYSGLNSKDLEMFEFNCYKRNKKINYDDFWKHCFENDRKIFFREMKQRLSLSPDFINFIKKLSYDRNSAAHPKLDSEVIQFVKDNIKLFDKNDIKYVELLLGYV